VHLGQILSLRKGCAATYALLPKVTAPLLVMQDARDRLVNPGNSWEIIRRASSRDATLILTRIQEQASVKHLITTHHETASLVEEAVVRFCRKNTVHSRS
jgi:esterase/lipase